MNSLRSTLSASYKGRKYFNRWDFIALLLALAVIAVFSWGAKQMSMPYHLGDRTPISLDFRSLPFYALRTVMRMAIAMVCSLLFTFIFGTWAAKSPRAERLIIPIIDILQSVPVLGFLSITIVGFIALFPRSMLGPECAAIFALFTSQAWNMSLGFYQTLRSVPAELKEAARMFHLSGWQQFWRIEVPFSLPGLLWNSMMSMSAGWFLLVAAEAISVANQQIFLPGMGSYIALAIQHANMHAIIFAIISMLVVILLYDQLIFRPLVAWAEKFKAEQVSEEEEGIAHSWLVDLLHRTRFVKVIGDHWHRFLDRLINLRWICRLTAERIARPLSASRERYLDWLWNALLITLASSALVALAFFILQAIPIKEILHACLLGCCTALRVAVLIVICSLLWVPIGVWIGRRPQVAALVQPLAQFLAAFPANFFYPLFVIMIVRHHLNVEIWLTPLMMLGTQWYVLFNVIAGASVIPKELHQVADNLGVPLWLRWRRLILPGIFPYYITGAITAVAGAWNASIVAEVVTWGNTTLTATGLGAYITQYAVQGDFPHVALGIGIMCIIVLLCNRLIWRPLYQIAITQFRLD